ncbi:hypothetical protein HAINFHK1212_2054 [Haemophilus influenzae HK1212]|uniref:Uncharacterized protein n=1 Tax=Haemophilus influenzae HK1212 TaxID=456482 RepID=A0A7G2JYI3_HAEIF|nr:hypothetical protein HAINFHK1212_2054 [Haemophilus influenzae HK1212]
MSLFCTCMKVKTGAYCTALLNQIKQTFAIFEKK